MCTKGYIEQTANKPTNQQSPPPASPSNSEPSVVDLIENGSNSQFNRYYDPQGLGDILTSQDLEAFQKQQQEMIMAASSNQPNGYSSQQMDSKKEIPQSLPTPLPIKIDKRTQLTNDDEFINSSKSQEIKNTNLELPIDERSIDGSKIDFTNQTVGVLEVKFIFSIKLNHTLFIYLFFFFFN